MHTSAKFTPSCGERLQSLDCLYPQWKTRQTPLTQPGVAGNATAPLTQPGVAGNATAPLTQPGVAGNATAPLTQPGVAGNATAPMGVAANPVKTYNLGIGNKQYKIPYQITGGKLDTINAQGNNATLVFNISTTSDGKLTLDLPRKIIDSKKQGGIDEGYAVFVDGQNVNADQIKNNTESRTLSIDFPKGASRIEIAGTHIVPGVRSTFLLNIGYSCKHNNSSLFKKSKQQDSGK